PTDSDGSLRRELGIAPSVWVELLGAYGRIGDLEQAARMVARLEDVCAGRDDASLWIHRARVMFLALAGRTDAVRALVSPRQARYMTTAARSYWMAVAHERRGDRAAAIDAYRRARARSRGRPRELIDGALARLAESERSPERAKPEAWDRRGEGSAEAAERSQPERAEVADVASEVVARIEAAPLPAPVELPKARRPRVTWTITLILLGVQATAALTLGQ